MGYLKNWCEKYGVERDLLTYGCEDLGDRTLGVSRYRRYEGERYADIRIHECLKDCSLTRMAVTWHEFCHSERWLKTGTTDGHGSEWLKRMWRQPFLALYDIFVSSIVFTIVRKRDRIFSRFDGSTTVEPTTIDDGGG